MIMSMATSGIVLNVQSAGSFSRFGGFKVKLENVNRVFSRVNRLKFVDWKTQRGKSLTQISAVDGEAGLSGSHQHKAKDTSNLNLVQTDSEDLAMIGLDAMQRANCCVEDFCRTYFMFHGIDVNNPEAIFKYLPVLSFTESYIYQLDCMNESVLHVQTNAEQGSRNGSEGLKLLSDVARFTKAFKNDPFRPLADLLHCQGLLTDKIKEEFKNGVEYWNLERGLCRALAYGKEISVEDVMRTMHLRSTDYRILNFLMYQMRDEPVNELHMEFFSVTEFLMELADDLFDYKEDVVENSFNFVRMLVRIYGSSTPTMLEKCITETEEKYVVLLNSLDSQLSSAYQRRCAEANEKGGFTARHPIGTWNIPPVILDEELYRLNMQQDPNQAASNVLV